jgi:hypothetical protein
MLKSGMPVVRDMVFLESLGDQRTTW